MIDTTKQYKDSIVSDHRKMKMKVVFNGRQEIDGHYLKNVTIKEVSNGQDTLTIGSVCSNSIKIDLFDPGNIPYENGMVEVFIGMELENNEWVSMGTFLLTGITRNNQYEVSLEGYDSISLLNKDYHPTILFPASLQDVVEDITRQCGITLKDQELDSIIIDHALEVTCKEMIGYMASLMGKNARMNRFHELEFFWYQTSNYVIPFESQYELGFKKNNPLITISSITSGDEDNVLTVGSGQGITFANPYMTQERLESIFETINGLCYLPATIKWRGDPSVEVVDMIQVEDHTGELSNLIIMENTITFDGGMSSSITCNGQNEKEVVMSKSPTEIKLKKFYHTLIESFKQTTEKILGHEKGYYYIDVDEDGYPSGWTIMNTPTLRDDSHLWKMTMGGFGYSEDGGKTFKNVAFDLDGNFNANVITTGVLRGEMFELDLETGVIKIGLRNEEGEMEHPSFYLNEKGELIIKAFEEYKQDTDETIHSLNTSFSIQQGNINQLISDTTIIVNGEEKTTKEAYSSLQQQIDEFDFILSKNGGNNKLLNSAGWNGTQFWKQEGNVTSFTNVDIRNNTVSGYGFEINQGKLQQSFQTIIKNFYTVSCKIKKYTNSCYLKIINGNEETYVFCLNNEYRSNWMSFHISFQALTSETTIEIYSDDTYLLISDIMVNDGEILQQWSSSNDEIYTANVKIDKTGISVSQDDTNNKTVINTHEFAGYDGQDRVFSLNGDTTDVNRLHARSDVQIGIVKAYAKTSGNETGLGFAYIKGGNQ